VSSLRKDLAERFRDKLIRSSLVSASRWATQHRVIGGDFPGKWQFETHPWLKGMHDSENEFNIGQKAAQLGYSETMLNIALFNLDIKQRNVLYILPNLKPDAHDFTTRAFNPAIEMSSYIKGMFTSTNNIGHKVAGNANLFIRGSNVRSALKSIPASVLIFDEFEEMDQDNVKLAEERSSGQAYRVNWKVSTPWIPNKGINTLFQRSTQDHFFFNCPRCSKLIELRFPESLIICGDDPDDPKIMESHLICSECKGRIEHHHKRDTFKTGRWVPTNPGRLWRGFYINQLYSPVLEPYKIAISWLESQRDQHAEQEFYNSKMGLPHTVAGATITEEMFEPLIKGYQMVEAARAGNVITMGIDVGSTVCHVEVCQWDLSNINPIDINAKAFCKVLWAGEIPTVDGLPHATEMMIKYNVRFAIIDAMPETNLATKWVNEHYGRARLCRYNHFATARSVFAGEKDVQVSVNRTAWLDQSLGRFRNKSIALPANLPRDYIRHIMAPVRTPCKDSNGNLVYKYLEQDGKPDHYAHARNYAEIALMFATGSADYKTIKERV
jgi:hypothetical protein